MREKVTPFLLLLLVALSFPLKADSYASMIFSGEIIEKEKSEMFKNWFWNINGISFYPTTDTMLIPLNKSGFDTIYFKRDDKPQRLILTKFSPGGVYEILFSACCFDFDIEDTKMLVYLNSLPLDSTDTHKRNNGKVQFKLLNKQNSDTLIGMFGNISSFFGGQILKNNGITTLINPFTTGLSTYIYKISIGVATQVPQNEILKDSVVYIFTEMTHGVQQPQYVINEILSTIEYRFFQKENLLVTFDHKINKMTLSII